NEEFLMEFSIFDALENGFDHIVVITKSENQAFLQQYLNERLPKKVTVDVIVQSIDDLPEGFEYDGLRQKPWGTAHAVWSARQFIKGDFVIINADDYYGKPAFKAAAEFIKENNSGQFGLVTYKLSDTLSEHGAVSRGVCKVDEDRLVSIEEFTQIESVQGSIIDQTSGLSLHPDDLVSMNFWVCNDKIFDYIHGYFKSFLAISENLEKSEIYLPFVIQEMMIQGVTDVRAIQVKSPWFGVTYYNDKLKAQETIKGFTDEGQYPSPMWAN
ncbi:MAG: sugar phosphate nucleotidyltransferase, partial [Bacteroidetes bacterium]|nr:sugar phosphate nucleotidyltransferase [Bacteroidota bacterium]